MADDKPEAALAQYLTNRRCDRRCPYWFECPVIGLGETDENGKKLCVLITSGDDAKARFLNLARSPDGSGVLSEMAKALWRFGNLVEKEPSGGNLATYADLLGKYYKARFPSGRKAEEDPKKAKTIDVQVREVPPVRRTKNIPGVGEVEVLDENDDPESLFNSDDEVLTGKANGQHDPDS